MIFLRSRKFYLLSSLILAIGLFAACMKMAPLGSVSARQADPVYDTFSARYPNRTILFLALDGIAYDLVDRLKSAGYFPSFAAPARLISTFPSTTIVGFTGLFESLGCGLPPGYESKYFSIPENRLRGYTYSDYKSLLLPFKDYFNYYRRTLFNKVTMYAFPAMTMRRDVARIREALLERPPTDAVQMAYIGGTDGAAHILGERRVDMMLVHLSADLESLRAEFAARHGQMLDVVIFSDHGFHFEDLKSVTVDDVAADLKKAGFSIAKRISSVRDVVPVAFGNLSSGVFYTDPTVAEKVAAVLAGVPGFDLAFYRRSDHEIGIQSHEGKRAIIEVRDGGNAFRYRPLHGDPLMYSPRISRLVPGYRYGHVSPWLTQAQWWSITHDHVYPDAFARLYDAFNRLTLNRAQVLISTLPGYEYGGNEARTGAEIHGGLKGTHGGLFKSSSSAVLMTTLPGADLPEAVSYRDFFSSVLGK